MAAAKASTRGCPFAHRVQLIADGKSTREDHQGRPISQRWRPRQVRAPLTEHNPGDRPQGTARLWSAHRNQGRCASRCQPKPPHGVTGHAGSCQTAEHNGDAALETVTSQTFAAAEVLVWHGSGMPGILEQVCHFHYQRCADALYV
jgi:hypothetical protein